jgi:hypothetical protein
MLIYKLLTTNTVEIGTAPWFFCGWVRKVCLLYFWKGNWERGKNTGCGGKGISKPHGEWENWWGLVEGAGGGWGQGFLQFLTFVFVAEYQEIEREKVVISSWRETCHITNGWRLFGNQFEARRGQQTHCSLTRQPSSPRCCVTLNYVAHIGARHFLRSSVSQTLFFAHGSLFGFEK